MYDYLKNEINIYMYDFFLHMWNINIRYFISYNLRY